MALPFKEEYPKILKLGESRKNVTAQFFQNETCLLRNPELKVQYDRVLEEYLDPGHMKEIPSGPSEHCNRYYLPHHAAVGPNSVTEKV